MCHETELIPSHDVMSQLIHSASKRAEIERAVIATQEAATMPRAAGQHPVI